MITELRISQEHAAYQGHFPGFPILPGAVLLDHALHEIVTARSLDLLHWRVASMKFLDIVAPGDPLTLEHAAADETTIRFTIRSAQRAIGSGVLCALLARLEDAHGA